MVYGRDRIKLELLKTISDEKVYSLYRLAEECKTNTKTIKHNLAFLEKIGLVDIDKVGKEESASGVPSYRVTITEKGLETYRELTSGTEEKT